MLKFKTLNEMCPNIFLKQIALHVQVLRWWEGTHLLVMDAVQSPDAVPQPREVLIPFLQQGGGQAPIVCLRDQVVGVVPAQANPNRSPNAWRRHHQEHNEPMWHPLVLAGPLVSLSATQHGLGLHTRRCRAFIREKDFDPGPICALSMGMQMSSVNEIHCGTGVQSCKGSRSQSSTI